MLELFDHPAHPYTRALLRSVPGIRDEEDRRLESIEGMVPEQYDRITGAVLPGDVPTGQRYA